MTKSSKATEFHSRRDCWGSLKLHILHSRVRYLLWLTCVSPFPRWPHMESHDSRGPGSHESLAGLVPGLSGPVGLGCGVIGGVEESLVFGLFRLEAGSAMYSFSTHAFRICCLLPCYLNKYLISENTPEPSTFWSGAPAHLFCSQDKFKRPTIRMMRTRRVVGCFRLEQSHQLPPWKSDTINPFSQVVFWYSFSGSETRKATSYQQTNLCAVCVLCLKKLLIHWIQKARKETTPLRWWFFVGGQKKTFPFFARPQDGSCEEVPVGWGICWTPGASFFRGEIFSFGEGTTSPA